MFFWHHQLPPQIQSLNLQISDQCTQQLSLWLFLKNKWFYITRSDSTFVNIPSTDIMCKSSKVQVVKRFSTLETLTLLSAKTLVWIPPMAWEAATWVLNSAVAPQHQRLCCVITHLVWNYPQKKCFGCKVISHQTSLSSVTSRARTLKVTICIYTVASVLTWFLLAFIYI